MEWQPAVRAFLERQRVARLATVDEEGRPHLIPMCFALLDGALVSVVDDKPKRSLRLRRLRNIQMHPEVAVLCDEYSEDWTRLAWVMLRGQASIIQSGEEHVRAVAGLRERYSQYRSHDLRDRPVIRIEAREALHWGLPGDEAPRTSKLPG